MARIIRYTKGDLSLRDQVIGTDAENQNATVNIPVAAIVDLAIDYFSTNGNGDGINESLLDITTSLDGLTTAVATYTNTINTHTTEIEAIVTRTETLESTFETNNDGTLTISAASITNFAETIAREGFASATTLDTLSSRVQQIIDGQLVIDTYATIEQLANTTSTLEGSIATLQDTLTTGYQNYADGIIQTDAFSQAISGLVTEANGDFASATEFTNLKAQFGTFDADGNLTGLSTALADKVTTTISGEGYATSSDLTTLEASLTSYIDGEIASSSTAGITGQQLTTVLEGYAEATELTEFKAEVGTFDADGNLVSLSTALADKVTQTIATENYATSSDVTALESTVNGNTATLTQTASTVADINGKLRSSYGLNLTAGNAVAGMTFLADGETELSEIKFVANTFKIDRPGGAISPFVVNADGTISLNGQVTFTSASTGQGIDFNDLSNYLTTNNYATTGDLPDTSAFLDQAALASYLQQEGYVTGNTAGITELQLLNILSGADTTVNTVIDGGTITTGIIANDTFAMPVSSPDAGFSVSGMGINLDNGSIHAKQFYINNDGSASFGGTHLAGSVGNWTVDSSGALKDSSSEIVLDPSGNYTEVGTEKLIMSSENLPAISPSAAVSANFVFTPGLFGSSIDLSGNNPDLQLLSRSNGISEFGSKGKRYKYYFPDLTGDLPGNNAQNNIAYDSYGGGTVDYSIPYAAGPDYRSQESTYDTAFTVQLGLQEEFGNDYGWGKLSPSDQSGPSDPGGDPGELSGPTGSAQFDYTSIPDVPDVVGLDYELKIEFTFTFFPEDLSGPVALGTEEKVLSSGSITKNLRDATSLILTPANSTEEYFGFNFDIPSGWQAGQIEGSFNPPANRPNIGTASDPGDIKVVARYYYSITNIYTWSADNTTSNYILNDTSQPWAYIIPNGINYLSSGDDLINSFSNVLFTGASAKTNIGLNGIQIRGNKGFVALGDNVPGTANAIAQFWGNAQVFGTLTSNSTQSFSDKNLKDNITPISNALDTVSKLAPVSFNWKPEMRGVDLETRYGFIAQDIKEVLPSIVKEGEHLTLEHNNIISINTAAIQELVNKINKLEEEIKTLKENNG